MLISLICCAAMCTQEPQVNKATKLFDAQSKRETSLILTIDLKAPTPKLSPKSFGDPPQHWKFDWLTTGYGFINASEGKQRFEVWSQERSSENDAAFNVSRMLMRLWEYNYNTLRGDHSETYGNRVIQAFLCFGGKPGGEQLFDEDDQTSPPSMVDTIYFYDLSSFTSPLEMAREVAHEYGHAFLPAIGGYTEPENWANGYLGEKLYLRHVEEAMEKGQLTPEDAMGATLPQLKTWVSTNVDDLVVRAAVNGPNPAALKKRTKAAMDEYIGLALYADTILPESAFFRSMSIVGSANAEDYPDMIVEATKDYPERYTLRIPSYLAGKSIWIPLAKGKISGATVIRKNGDWAMIRPTGPVTIVPQHDP